ncbi:MAG TPA: glycoside hydrolase family 16 protein [Stackebrandtia sp.]|jgi:hypothetical protein|uniref:glycoside hydrolase family 16 protein n=1 Tax=Stackebrandtia sp. TaxID=2023065 RepID=UPI002D2D91D5|nr:glycoside hydrolase family 16 protein [Stackebrandtia sp.]HZE41497.1 glycoside hydrolase family 16 protein [Stackebrandtia sp.]
MRKLWVLVAAGAVGTVVALSVPSAFAEDYAFADEFAGTAGTAPDSTKWTQETGCEWGSGKEQQCYTDGGHNAELDGNGHLLINARAEKYNGNDFTSARLRAKTMTGAGTVEVRAKFSGYQAGAWPAIWTTDEKTWPVNGEIDLMEIGLNKTWKPKYHTHYGTRGDVQSKGGIYADDPDDAGWTGWHTYKAVYTNGDNGSVKFYIDDVFVAEEPYQVPDDAGAQVILNIAVGSAAGTPDPKLDNTMTVDYVHVTQR